MNAGISIGAGTPVENAGKSVIALSGMRQKLLANGYKVGVLPESIVDTWNKFKSEKPDLYRSAHEAILKNTRFVADVSDSAKMQTAYVRRWLGPIKTYAIQQSKSAFDDAIDTVSLAFKNDPQYKEMNKDALKRTLSRVASYGIGTLASMAIIDKADDELEKFVEEKWNATYGYDPLALMKGSVGVNSIAAV
jgi:putative ribosome biogenesis GTPase RsgA